MNEETPDPPASDPAPSTPAATEAVDPFAGVQPYELQTFKKSKDPDPTQEFTRVREGSQEQSGQSEQSDK